LPAVHPEDSLRPHGARGPSPRRHVGDLLLRHRVVHRRHHGRARRGVPADRARGDRQPRPPPVRAELRTVHMAQSATVEAQPRKRSGLVALFSADLISTLGTWLSIVAVPWLVLQTTGSPAKMGLAAAAEWLP